MLVSYQFYVTQARMFHVRQGKNCAIRLVVSCNVHPSNCLTRQNTQWLEGLLAPYLAHLQAVAPSRPLQCPTWKELIKYKYMLLFKPIIDCKVPRKCSLPLNITTSPETI